MQSVRWVSQLQLRGPIWSHLLKLCTHFLLIKTCHFISVAGQYKAQSRNTFTVFITLYSMCCVPFTKGALPHNYRVHAHINTCTMYVNVCLCVCVVYTRVFLRCAGVASCLALGKAVCCLWLLRSYETICHLNTTRKDV